MRKWRNLWIPALRLGAALMGAALLGGCASGVGMVVTSISDPDEDLSAVRTFDLATTEGNEALVEKNLLRMVEREMLARGYTRDAGSPDVLVAVLGDVEARREYVPPSTTYSSWYEPGDTYTITKTRRVDGRVVRSRQQVRTSGDWVYVPHTTPGYERTVFARSVVIRMLDAAGAPDSVDAGFDAVPVWEARASSVGDTPDLLAVAPLLIREALGEFPEPSGKPSRRNVQSDAGQNASRAPNG